MPTPETIKQKPHHYPHQHYHQHNNNTQHHHHKEEQKMSPKQETTTNIRKPKPIPFLELSSTTLSTLDQNSIDFENVLSVWTGLTKSSSYVRNGKRLENISWRVINRGLINSKDDKTRKNLKLNENDFNTLINISSSRSLQQPFLDELHQHQHITPKKKRNITPQRPRSRESLFNNRNSSTSLHKGFSNSSLDQQQHNNSNNNNNNKTTQQFPKRPGNPRQVSEISIQNIGTEITEEVSSSDEDIVESTTTSSNKSIPKQSNKTSQESVIDDDLEFHQPEPKFVSELFQNSNSSVNVETDVNDEDIKNLNLINQELQNEKPPMLRTSTSTSIVRGFSPSHISVSYTNVAELTKKNDSSNNTSLFANTNNSIEEVDEEQNDQQKASSLFKQEDPVQNSIPKVSSLFASHEKVEQEALPKVSSLFSNNNNNNQQQQEEEKIPPVSSLFGKNDKETGSSLPPVTSLFANKSELPKPPLNKSTTVNVSSLFNNRKDGTSPTNKLPKVHKNGKKQNLLNNLGMTSLHSNNSTSSSMKDPNNMFFIESSPSPAESDIVGSIDNITLDDHFKHLHSHLHDGITHPNHHHHHHHQSSEQEFQQIEESSATIKPQLSISSPHEQSNTSLFKHTQQQQQQQLIYSSDSYSDDSDWSSVSDDSESGSDDAEYHRQRWKEESLKFSKKDDTKPQIKRSLLSGLFLNEMLNHPHEEAELKKPVLLRSSTDTKNHIINNHHHHHNQQQHIIESKSSLEISSSFNHHQRKSTSVTPSQTTINALASVTSPPPSSSSSSILVRPNIQRQNSTSSVLSSSLQKNVILHLLNNNIYGSSIDKKNPQQSPLTRLMSKSALNLTSYFVNSRRPSHAQSHHQSNAPPTASTLLPTALATHMFIPNVHQRARSKLSSVVEDNNSSSVGSSTKSESLDNKQQQQQQQRKPSLPTLIPAPKSRTSSFVSVNDARPVINDDNSSINSNHQQQQQPQVIPGEKLSPRLSRKLMLATELSESLRNSMIWDRQLTNVKLNDGFDKKSSSKVNDAPDLDNSSISDIEDIDKKNLLSSETSNNNKNNNNNDKMISSVISNHEADNLNKVNENTWDDEDELDYHTKGW